MPYSETETANFKKKVGHYKEMLENTRRYREAWKAERKQTIIARLTELAEAGSLECEIEERNDIQNLEAVALSLGHSESGLGESVGGDLRRDLIKQNGSLVYQQLFNGKILVLINLPFIEKYGQPQPPRTIAIYRPEEIQDAYILRHIETFITEVAAWEDYDDDLPEPNQRIGFKMNFEQEQK